MPLSDNRKETAEMPTALKTHRDLRDFAKLIALHETEIRKLEETQSKLSGYDLIEILVLSDHPFAERFSYLTGSADTLQEKFDNMINHFKKEGKSDVAKALNSSKNKRLVDIQFCVFLANKTSDSKMNYSFKGEEDIKKVRFITGRVLGFVIHWQILMAWFNSTLDKTLSKTPERSASPAVVKQIDSKVSVSSQQLDGTHEFDPASTTDAREKVDRSIAVRRGQIAFRNALLSAYSGTCAITGCDAIEALEAAHIMPYKGKDWNHPSNGILLRADIHTLFDLYLIGIDPESYEVIISSRLRNTEYVYLVGKKITHPDSNKLVLSKEALASHASKLINE